MMNKCPLCQHECPVTPAQWSGGRLSVACNTCGVIEIAEDNYLELLKLPDDHWQKRFIREGLASMKGPVKITRSSTNVLQVAPVQSRLSKMEKRSLRRRAEGKGQTIGHIVYVRDSDPNDS